MKPLLLLPFAIFMLLASCSDSKIPEGEIEYVITYPYTDVSGLLGAVLPEKATLVFKGTKMKTNIARGKIFTTDVISDEATHSVEMRLDFGDKFFYAELTAADLKTLIASQPKYKLASTSKQDSVQGMWASEYTVDCSEDSVKHPNAWFTEDLSPAEGLFYSSYKEIKGIPLVFDFERYGVIMHLEAVNFKKREVLDSEFERDPTLVKVEFSQYESEVQELFDILME